jgi:hypothetical protein
MKAKVSSVTTQIWQLVLDVSALHGHRQVLGFIKIMRKFCATPQNS